jgi:membrane peptidoglycan carboxypeptidase
VVVRVVLAGTLVTATVLAAIALYALLVVAPSVAPVGARAKARVQALLAQHHGAYLYLSEMGTWLPRATIDIEDHRFYSHGAIDLLATARALLFDLRGGRPLQGGSTIDVQLAERLLGEHGPDRLTYALQVLLLARDLDARYGKPGVLALYLDDIYYGSGAYGAAAAAQTFFASTPAQLTSAQAAFLAGLPNAPSIYGDHPASAPTRARWRQVLQAMVRANDLSATQAQQLLAGGTPQRAASTVAMR